MIAWCGFRACQSDLPDPVKEAAVKSVQVQQKQSRENDSINKVNDSLIALLKAQELIYKDHVSELSERNSALRAIVSKLQPVRIDSSGQTVNVPAVAYNAGIESGNLCDSLLMYMDKELAIKDSIISTREIQLQASQKLNVSSQKAINDLLALNEQEESKRKTALKLNKKIPLIAGIAAVTGYVFALTILK